MITQLIITALPNGEVMINGTKIDEDFLFTTIIGLAEKLVEVTGDCPAVVASAILKELV